MTVASPTPHEILCELFGPEWAGNVHLASRTHDEQGGWHGYRVSERFPDNAQLTLPANRDNYFSVGMQSRETRDRKAGNVILDYLIVLDDVGTKAPQLHAEGLRAFGLDPVMVLESSPGNFQYFYRLDEPVGRLDPDQKQRVAMIDIIRGALGQGLYSDGAVHDPSRYMRLPFGINTKPKYKRPDGSFPEVALIEWNPGARVSLELAGQAFVGADWAVQVAAYQPGQRPASAATGGASGDRQASMRDANVILAMELGMRPQEIRAGVVEALCPNRATHTGQIDTGFAFINPYRGHCQHEHCQHLSAGDFMDMMEAEYETRIASDVASGLLIEDGEGELRTRQGEVKPRTGKGFMARAQFVAHELTAAELVLMRRASENYEANRDRCPDWVRAENDNFCIVRTINGVLHLNPAPEENVHFNVLNVGWFRTYADRTKLPVGKKGELVGVGSAWLDHPMSRSYEQIGLWHPPGSEPADSLNLWRGIEGANQAVPVGASCLKVLAYIRDVIAGGRAHVYGYVMDWLAWKLQNPLGKPGVNIVLFGEQGTGKSTLGEMIISLLGPRYAMAIANDQHLLGNFNAHLEGKLFLMVDEALFGKDPRIAGRYKALTTEPTMVIERKGVDARTVANMLALLICSNSLAGVPIEPKDRRATVIQVANTKANDTAYFKELWAEWEADGRLAFLHHLLARDVSQFDPRLCLDLPEKAEMAMTTADTPTRYWLDRLFAGQAPNGGDWTKPLVILNNDLMADHIAWASLNHVKPASRAELSRRIGELCPSRTNYRRAGKDTERERGFTYPDFNSCQLLADIALGAGTHAKSPG
jgi:energy-coupling factor transporter ATP-binding protein EcfA2